MEPSPPSTGERPTALLLIAHGSREEGANTDLHYMVSQIRGLQRYALVEAAFLELAEPDIDQAATDCVRRGIKCIILLPYFLSAGVHVRRDLTAARQRLAGRFPEVRFRLAEPLGRHALLLEVVVQRAREAE
jgi:sirohydrochlorin ferrochelatase